ncbi:hypothetical protein F4778DRAFT_748380 [Xylariomycetidae sp. FL2044]|nr:hypothetical protein F4778DRAFT_748380 [Xylariomycetidae sp. FL2044]
MFRRGELMPSAIIMIRLNAHPFSFPNPKKKQAAIYGKCIVADYNSVHKDKCATEFMRLKDCYLKAAKKPR